MTFLWPQGLWLLVLVPALAAGYGLVRARKRASPGSYPGLAAAMPARFWRWVPPLLFASALTLLLLAAARPTARLWLPAEASTVILAIDVSSSMRASDVAPTRLGAAREAAREFVRDMAPGARIGIVAFSTEARLLQAPVAEREQVLRAIDSLAPDGDTAIGSGILVSLAALQAASDAGIADSATAVILLTDGQNSHGPDPLEAARRAARIGVRVYTIGIGTAHGRIKDEGGWAMTVGIDTATLRQIAGMTGAEYSYALTAWHLKRIYAGLSSKVVLASIRTEIGALLCALAALAGIGAAAASLRSYGRVL